METYSHTSLSYILSLRKEKKNATREHQWVSGVMVSDMGREFGNPGSNLNVDHTDVEHLRQVQK